MVEPDEGAPPGRVDTAFLRDDSRSVISTNRSPDIPYDASLNPYRGCEHGCAYCYARTYHEYLDMSAGLDFETRILVKEDAPELLRRELGERTYRPRPLNLSGVTDAYQPAERRLRLTRRCLEVLAEHLHPVTVVTKNALVTRDLDLLARLARHDAAQVWFSIVTLDAALAARLEPRTSQPRARLEAMRRLTDGGVPCGVILAPVVPGLTDHEIPAIVAAAAEAGAAFARWSPLRLPGAVAELFTAWLEEHEPLKRDRVLNRLRQVRGGSLGESRFHVRMRGEGVYARQLDVLFATACRRHGLATDAPSVSAASFCRPGGEQLSLFGAD